ncbi:MAG: HEAT repeat domain-containing protein [Deltaproteobacteria bacterium]|nr:HEAT repeat domain-containing protein [Deltaproteobacteria bacterium]
MKKKSFYPFIIIFLSMVLFTCSLSAAQKSEVELSDKTIVSVNGSTVTLLQDKKVLWQKEFAGLKKLKKINVDVFSLQGGGSAVLINSKEPKNKNYKIVLLKKEKSSALEILFEGSPQYKGDSGERYATEVRIERTGGDEYVVVKGTVYDGAHICGENVKPLIFRDVYDLKKGKFVEASLNRFFADAILIEGTPVDTSSEKSGSGNFLIPEFASSVSGDEHSTIMLTPPYSVVDNNPLSYWEPGSKTGIGEFITFNTKSSLFEITEVTISLDAGKKRRIRPASLFLVSDSKSYLLKFPKEGKHINFKFPKAFKSSCISVVIDSIDSKSGNKPPALQNITLLTQLDSKEGLSRLVKMLNDSKQGEEAVMTLRGLHLEGAAAIRESFNDLTVKGQKRGAKVLADVDGEGSVSILAKTAVTYDRDEIPEIITALVSLKDKAVAGVSPYADSKDDEVFKRALYLLEMLNTGEAFKKIASLNSKTKKRRERVKAALAEMLNETNVEILIDAINNAKQSSKNFNHYFDLLNVAADSNSQNLKSIAATLANETFINESSFENRYRSLNVLITADDNKFFDTVLEAAVDKDREIRAAALKNIWKYKDGENDQKIISKLTAAFGDGEPAVRLAALESFKHFIDETTLAGLELLLNDPWPYVRREVIENAALLKGENAAQIIVEGMNDESPLVIMAALKGAKGFKGSKQIDNQIIQILKDKKSKPSVLSKSAETLSLRCIQNEEAIDALMILLQKGAEPLADKVDIMVAVSCAKALGVIGTKKAIESLKEALKRSNPATDRAIKAALQADKNRCK